MKKIISLVLVLVFCLCSLSAFAMDANLYSQCVDTIGTQALELTIDTVNVEGSINYCPQGYPSFAALVDGSGNVSSVVLSTTVTLEEFSTVGEQLGIVMALATMSASLAKDGGDLNVFASHMEAVQTELNDFSTNLINMLSNITGNSASFDSSVAGGTANVTISLDGTNVVFDFTYTPAF